jgi:hypothetical protein
MMKNYMTTKNLARNKKPEGDSAGKEATPFPEEKVVMLIYGGQAPHKSRPKLKHTGRAIHSISMAVPEYLRWSESLFSFHRMDHPNMIAKLGTFPLIVDPLVGQPGLPRPSWTGAAASTSCPRHV